MQSTSWETLGWKKHKLESQWVAVGKKKRSISPLPSFSLNTDDQYFLQDAEAENLTILCAVLWLVGQSCQTLCNRIDGSPPGLSVPGFLQAKTLEWVAISFSNAWKWSHSVVSNSAYKLNKQGDNIWPWHTPFPIWNQSVVPCPVITVASWPYKFVKRQVRWSDIPTSYREFSLTKPALQQTLKDLL